MLPIDIIRIAPSSTLTWFKVYTDKSPGGFFVQAKNMQDAILRAERDGRGRVTDVHRSKGA